MVAGGEPVGHLSRTHRLASVPGDAFREMGALARVPFEHDVSRVGILGHATRSVIQQPVPRSPDHDLLLRRNTQLHLNGVDGVSDGGHLDFPCLRNRNV